jgi:DedD protein
MTDQLKRRLIGAAIIVLVALALAALLPEPRLQRAAEDDMRVVTIPLQDDAIVGVPPAIDEGSIGAAADEGSPPEIAGGDAAPSTAAAATPLPPAPTATATPTPAPTAKPTPTSTPKPVATPTPTPMATPKLTAAPTSTPAPTPAPTARPQPTAAPAAAGRELWWVQVGSYADIGNAREVESRLAAIGQRVVVAPIDAAAGTLYRVRAGPYDTAARAEAAHAQITGAGLAEARVVKP